MTNYRLLIYLLAFFSYSCNSRFDGEVVVVGRTVSFDSDKNIINVRTDSAWREIELKGDTTKSYNGLIWANTNDDFLAIEYSENKIGRIIEGDIVRFNMNGDLVQKVLDCKAGEVAEGLSLSKNDNRLLFSLKQDHYDSENSLTQPKIFFIADYRKGEIIKTIDTVEFSLNVWTNNNPWLRDEKRFIYDFRADRKIKIVGDKREARPLRGAGIYIYDIERDEYSLIIPDGYSGNVSPTADRIAYLKDRGIWVYDVNTKSTELLYTLRRKERATSVEWTPDGNYIYIVSYDYMFGFFFNSYQTLIRLVDKKLMKVK